MRVYNIILYTCIIERGPKSHLAVTPKRRSVGAAAIVRYARVFCTCALRCHTYNNCRRFGLGQGRGLPDEKSK